MVLDNIGNHSLISDLRLGLETALLVLIRSDLAAVIPAFIRTSADRFIEIKHTGKISVLSDEIRNLLRLFIKDFPYGKSIVLLKSPVSHLTQKFSDPCSFLQHLVDAA